MATARVTWCRHAIEDHFSEEFWLILHQWPSDWDQHSDTVSWHIPAETCTVLALTWPEWQWADVDLGQ